MAGTKQYPGIRQRGETTFELTITDGYTEIDGKKQQKRYYKTVTAKNAKEAADLRAKWIIETKGGALLTNNKMTLKEFYAYFKKHSEKLAPKTLLAYDGFFTRIETALGHKQLDDVTPNHIRTFINNLSEPGVYKGTRKNQTQLSSTMIQKHHKLLNVLFNRAVKWGLTSINPCDRTDTPKAKSPRINVYDEKTLSEFLAKLDTAELKYQAAMLLALSTGIRRGELSALRWCDVDIDNCTIQIEHTLQYIPGKGLSLKDTKTESSERPISIPKSVIEVLERHKIKQSSRRLELGLTKNGGKWEGADESKNDFIFTTWNGKNSHPDTLNKWLSKFTKANDLSHISPHSFRHMAASFLIRSGVDIRTVSAKLGHARTSTTTDIYAHVIQSAEQQTADIMGSFLEKSTLEGKNAIEKRKKQAK